MPKSKNRFGKSEKYSLTRHCLAAWHDLQTSFHHVPAAYICLDSRPLREYLEPQYSKTDKLLARLTVCKDRKNRF